MRLQLTRRGYSGMKKPGMYRAFIGIFYKANALTLEWVTLSLATLFVRYTTCETLSQFGQASSLF